MKDVRDAPDLRLLVLHDGLEGRRYGPHHVRVGPRRRVYPTHAVEEDAAPGRVSAGEEQNEARVHQFGDAVVLDVSQFLEPVRMLLPHQEVLLQEGRGLVHVELLRPEESQEKDIVGSASCPQVRLLGDVVAQFLQARRSRLIQCYEIKKWPY